LSRLDVAQQDPPGAIPPFSQPFLSRFSTKMDEILGLPQERLRNG
jgi:hypothetical protein